MATTKLHLSAASTSNGEAGARAPRLKVRAESDKQELSKPLIARLKELLGRGGRQLQVADGSDDLDNSVVAQAQDVDAGLSVMEAGEIAQIYAALHAIRTDVYGVCNHCNGLIPAARLNAIPSATACVPCKTEIERGGGEKGKGGNYARAFVVSAGLEQVIKEHVSHDDLPDAE